MDEYRIDQALQAFERIETALVEFSKHVPIIPENEILKAPSLIPSIVSACGLIDSLFRDSTSDPVSINGQSKTRRECDICDFARVHATSLDLPNTRSVLLVSPPRFLVPFKAWESVTPETYPPLLWWQDYNGLKHDWLANINKGTLGTALQAVCGLHQIISRRRELVRYLLRRRWVSCGEFAVHHFIPAIVEGRQDCIVQTQLFATPMGKRQFPEDLNELDAGYYICKTEFSEFLGWIPS